MARKNDDTRRDFMKAFGERLKEIMKKRGVSQKAAGDALRVSAQAVNLYVSGDVGVDPAALVKLSKLLNVSTDYLLGLTQAETSDSSIRAICDYTGLTATSVAALNFETRNGDSNRIIEVLNLILEDSFLPEKNNNSLLEEIAHYILGSSRSNRFLYDEETGDMYDLHKLLQPHILEAIRLNMDTLRYNHAADDLEAVTEKKEETHGQDLKTGGKHEG